MSEKITSTSDPRIASDVEARNRVQVEMQALLDLPEEKFDAQALEQVKALEAQFDGYTERIEVRKSAAAKAADTDFGNAILEQGKGEADLRLTPHQRDQREPNADELIKQSLTGGGDINVRLRSEALQAYSMVLDASSTEREARALFQGQAGGDSPFSQDVIARIAGTNVDTVADIQPTGVEARFVEVLRNINGPHKCGLEVWYTQDLASRKLPKAVPGGTNPRTTVAAERGGNDPISQDNNPTFADAPTTTPREFAALFAVERSADRATPAMVGAKVGELLAREIGEQIAGAASVGTAANTSEGLTPSATFASTQFPTSGANSWLNGASITSLAAVPTFENVLDIMGAKPDFPATGAPMGDVWHISKSYAFTLMKIKGTDGHPIFQAMGMRGSQPIDTIYGRPVVYSDFLSGTNVSNRLLAVFGDFWAGAICRRGGDIELATDSSVFFDRNQNRLPGHYVRGGGRQERQPVLVRQGFLNDRVGGFGGGGSGSLAAVPRPPIGGSTWHRNRLGGSNTLVPPQRPPDWSKSSGASRGKSPTRTRRGCYFRTTRWWWTTLVLPGGCGRSSTLRK